MCYLIVPRIMGSSMRLRMHYTVQGSAGLTTTYEHVTNGQRAKE